jgi:hypothetical protein
MDEIQILANALPYNDPVVTPTETDTHNIPIINDLALYRAKKRHTTDSHKKQSVKKSKSDPKSSDTEDTEDAMQEV